MHEGESVEPVEPLKLAVKKINVSTYGFSNDEKKKICECEVKVVDDENVEINYMFHRFSLTARSISRSMGSRSFSSSSI